MFDTIESAIEDIKNGKMIIVVDDEDRENEGDFVMAADLVTAESINTMATLGRGLICTPLDRDLAIKFNLPLMLKQNDSAHHTAFTISIDHKDAGTGISCVDRAITIKALVREETLAEDFLRPGHIFPLIAKDGGVIERAGHTEASVDFCKLAGLNPVGVICEIMNDDGTMARVPELKVLAKEKGFKLVSIEQLKEYLLSNPIKTKQSQMYLSETINFPTKYGNFKLSMFEDPIASDHHTVVHMGDIDSDEPVLVRIHSECLTGDVFGSSRCDCGDQLEQSMKEIAKRGLGAIVYLRQEGRGIGLPNKIRAYALQDKGLDTFEANESLGLPRDSRNYKNAVNVLKILGVKNVELITNNPQKIAALEAAKFDIVNRHILKSQVNEFNHDYLLAKKNITKHNIDFIN